MFILRESLVIWFASPRFINTFSLPPAQALEGTTVTSMLTYILPAMNGEAIELISDVKTRLRAMTVGDAFSKTLTIGDNYYNLSFRMVEDRSILGNLTALAKPENCGVNRQAFENNPSQTMSKEFKAALSTINPTAGVVPFYSNQNRPRLPRLLIIDSHQVSQQLISLYLSPDFPEPIGVNSVQDALQTLKQQDVDIVLIDLELTKEDGLEAALEIQNNPAFGSDFRLIGMTADRDFQGTEAYRNMGLDDVISKPVTQDVLTRAVLNVWQYVTAHKNAEPIKLDPRLSNYY